MATLTFVYRTDADTRHVLQERQPGFLYLGSLRIKDGRDFSLGHLTFTNIVRPLSFLDPSRASGAQVAPGTNGLRPLQFLQGSISIRGVTRKVILLTYSQTHQFLRGQVSIKSSSALGAVSDFAIWGIGAEDPQDFYVETATNLDSGNVTEAWTRNNVTFVPHRNTRYLAVGSRVYNMPSSGGWRNQYFKKWMVEPSYVGSTGPSPHYGKAREVIVNVRPDRLNYFTNPGFEANANDVTAGSGAPTRGVSTAQHDSHGAQSLLLTSTTAAANLSGNWNSQVAMPVGWWTLSWFIFSPLARTCYPTITQNGVTQTGTAMRVGPNQWTRVWHTFKTNALTTFDVGFNHVADASQAAGALTYMDSVLLEYTPFLRDYFDGSTSPDTLWESGGTDGQARAYLYKNRADRYAAIKRVMEDNVPFGIGLSEPRFGTLPVESGYDQIYVPPVVGSLYGGGLYGDGPYGG